MNSDDDDDEEFYDCVEPVRYFAVACPKSSQSIRGGPMNTGLVTTDINEAKKKIKAVKGSRFNSFYDLREAEKFSKTFLNDESESTKEKTKSQKLYTESFSDVQPIILNNFKDAIESGDEEKCNQIIWNNPRNLVTQSNFPSLLRASSFHYNALHVATASNKPGIVRLILDKISQDEFWQRIYPTSDELSNMECKLRVTDMFLNNPENKNLETPLHIAAKFGFSECLRLLLNEELTDTSLRNCQGLRAQDIVCNRYDKEDRAEKYASMKDMFSEKYVVLAEGDKIQILEPIDHCDLLRLLRATNETYRANHKFRDPLLPQGDVRMNIGSVRAYVGPLPESAAIKLRGRWTVLNAEDAIKFEEIRRKDSEKGLECHGRYLAQVFGAPWKESWSFLHCYTDLSNDDGLSKLDEFLEEAKENTSISVVQNASLVDDEGDRSRFHALYSSLVTLFSRMTLNSSFKIPSASPIKDCRSPERAPKTPGQTPLHKFVTSTPMMMPRNTSLSNLRSRKTPFNSSLLGRGLLTPTDRQVRHAVLSTSQGRYLKFPRVSSWISELSLLDPETGVDSGSSFITSTPFKRNLSSRPNIRPTTTTSSLSLSPFSLIELQD